MKKKITLLFFGFLLAYGFSQQQKSFSINWGENHLISTGPNFKLEIPGFDTAHFNFDFSKGLEYVDQWPVSSAIDENSVVVQNVSYATISRAELKGLKPDLIPTSLKVVLKNSTARDKNYAFLSVSPIIKTPEGGFKKVTSISISYANGSFNRNNGSMLTIGNSVLSSGDWYKFYVDTTGVFRLSKSFLDRLGIRTNNINPQEIKIYGNGGKMVPYRNAQPFPFDVEENAILVVGEEDGVFNNNDYILFYAQGPNGYDQEKRTHINCYNDKTYYYITVGDGQGKRIQPAIQPTDNATVQINTFQEYQFYESDQYNIGNIGRRWFGNRFDMEPNQDFEFEFPNLVTTQPVSLTVYVAAASETATSMALSVNGTALTSLNLTAAEEPNLGTENNYTGQVNVNSSTVTVGLQYNNNGNPSALGYLDYIAVEATRNLTFANNQFLFKNSIVNGQSGVAQYNLSNASQVSQVWDVTDIYNVQSYNNTDAASTFSFKAAMGTSRQYVTVSSLDYFTPSQDNNTKVTNQNIKGTIFNNAQGNFQDVDYVIVTPENLFAQAERLAQINRDVYNLNVKVFTLNSIYSEFNTGNPDIGAIRNLIKYVYDNASTPENRIKYVCLFGDASFDYKDRIPNNTNVVPAWHSYNSFNLTNAFVSDDFYGMMDSNEGTMITSDRLDIAVGRIIVDSPQQAKEVVDKIDQYHKETALGNWRNNFVLVSDDLDESWERVLQETTDAIGDEVTAEKPFINVTKIHADAFQQQSSSGGERYPAVNEAMVSAIEKGALVVNYFGHGGEDGLSHERFFMKPDIEDLRNVCKYNCFVTVTCEFTRFDNPFRPTAGEMTFWNPQGGAIGLITTTRQIFVSVGITFNVVLSQYLFSYNDTDNYPDHEYPSMAEALRLTKTSQSISGVDQRHLVFFIGDPAMKLTFGKPDIRLTHVNDVAIDQETDVLSALSHAKLSGEVTNENGELLVNYNGILSATIYDKNTQRQTLANDGTTQSGQVIRLDFETLGPIIFRGQASITNGKFEFDFVVPRDIAIPEGTGKVSFYATTDNLLQDNTGASVGVLKIGGINENAAEDSQGPVINLYMNDENFVSGGITNESPTLLAKLQDENGINTASGIGHDIVAILDGDETNPYIINDYYQTEVDDYQRGTVSFPFRDLEPGLHTLSLKAWDVYNNSSTSEIQFMVYDEDQKLVVKNVLNYPNPFVSYTEFWFNHNSSTPLDVSVQIFTVSGKLVKTINAQTNSAGCCDQSASALSRDIVWDGRDDFGDKIGKGVYVYKLTVYSPTLNKKIEKFEKLVIL